jgi:hypothetical protein
MPEYTVKVPPGRGLTSTLANMPASLKEILKRGCASIGEMTPEALENLRPLAKKALEGSESALEGEFPSLGIGAERGRVAVAAAAFLATLIAGDSSTKEILETLPTVLEGPVPPQVISLINTLGTETQGLRSLYQKYRLSNATLPSFRKLDISVDLRIDFQKDGSPVTLPIAIAYLDTDAAHQKLWFQMTESQVSELIEQLEKVRENLKRAASMRMA